MTSTWAGPLYNEGMNGEEGLRDVNDERLL